jgi:hypothetical protein
MTIRFPIILLVLVLCGVFRELAVGQNAQNIIDAPFTATETFNEAGQTPVIMRIARASDGSTYRGSYGHDGNFGQVFIEDVPNHRRIEYPVPPPNIRDHTYRLTPQSFSTESIEKYRERLRRSQQHFADDPDDVKAGRQYHHIPLGEKAGDGMMLFGVRAEETFADGTKRISEHWDSDWGITMSRTSTGPQEGKQMAWVVTDIRREEPDPSLFQIPKEYFSDPLLEVNTVFIDNQTGVPEVLDMATTQLNSWKWPPVHKPLTIVQEKNAADLTAVFTKISAADLQASHQAISESTTTPTSGIKLQVYLRGSPGPEFENAMGSSGTAKGDGRAAQMSVTALWNVVLNARVGQWPPPGGSQSKDLLTNH